MDFAADEHFHFYLHDDAFAQCDWQTDISFRLDDLIRERLIQLRDSYKYTRLFYSAGSDSHTILSAAIEYGIPFDEIVCVRIGVNRNFEGLDNQEITKGALPYLNSQRETLRNTKVTCLDFGNEWFHAMHENEAYKRLNFPFFRRVLPSHIYTYFPRSLSCPDNFCDVMGLEKPRVEIRNGMASAFLYSTQLSYTLHEETVEDFFVTPDFPELHVSQSQALMRAVQSTPDVDTNTITNAHVFKKIRREFPADVSVGKGGFGLAAKDIAALQACVDAQLPYAQYFHEDMKEWKKQSEHRLQDIRNMQVNGIPSRKFTFPIDI